MLRDAMSFSTRTDSQVRAMEKQIDDLSWGFELYDPFTLTHNITFTLKNAGHIPAKAAIHRLSGYSTHANRQTLCDWMKSMTEPPGDIRLKTIQAIGKIDI